ncbi:uncharacterized protein LOC118997633 [Sturnira hondurensis]|uniref:uncharacterized protein LOC118997633 n=1 Tax=Sturnira hondurensis TaxID=192404 RepID=UPI001879200B|nr:uncharacterized protein LOC118997633 [Sturnira hondurensis]
MAELITRLLARSKHRSDVPPGEVVVSGKEALEEARGPSPAAAGTVVPALPCPERPCASRQAAAAGHPAAQAQPPGLGARLHGRGRGLQPPKLESVALSARLQVAVPRAGCLWPGVPPHRKPLAPQMVVRSGGDEWEQDSARTRAQSCCSTLGTCSTHFTRRPGAGGGSGLANARPMGVNGGWGGGGAGSPPPPSLPPPSGPLLPAFACSSSISSCCRLLGAPCERRQSRTSLLRDPRRPGAQSLGDSTETEGHPDPEATSSR